MKNVPLSPLARKLAPAKSKIPTTKLNADGQPTAPRPVNAIVNKRSIFGLK